MEMMMMAAFEEALSLTEHYIYSEEAIQIQQALHASLSSSSSSRQISCEICTEEKQQAEMLALHGCAHSFCILCVSKHVEYKLRDNVINIWCPAPNCGSAIHPHSLRAHPHPHVAPGVLDRWEEAVAESAILAWQRVRCPYQECGEVMVKEEGEGEGEEMEECECPWCHRLFCAGCGVAWHQGKDCREFRREREQKKKKKKKGKREKEGLRRLARENNWRKCPSCRLFVDKIEGCIHITCRCKFEFCYACGENWNESHWNTCQDSPGIV